MVKISSLRVRLWQIVVVVVISAVAVVTTSVAVKLHVPLETGSTLVTGKHARGKVAAFDMGH